MAKQVTAYEVLHIEINCVRNDPTDIKCGGPQYLGFDFFIDPEEEKEIVEHIRAELQDYAFPNLNIRTAGKSIKKKLWTKEMITTEIHENAGYF